MPDLSSPALTPLVDKLVRHSQLGAIETEALLALPCRLASGRPGTYLVREGDKAGSCILLLSGFVYRSKSAGNGARQILAVHLQGDLVDFDNGLLDGADHSVQALTHAQAAYIPRQAILNVAQAHPAVALALWRDTMVDGSIYREWMLNIGRRNARQRIAHLLCELAVRQQAAGICEGPRYEWPLTQEQVGDATGLTPVHVNRTLQSLRKDGLVIVSGRSVTITDWPKLQAAGDFNRAYLNQAAPVAA